MKKISILLIALVLVFSLSACQNRDGNSKTVDLEYYAKLGQIPESEYMLYSDVDKVKEIFSEKAEEEEEFYFSVYSGEKSVLLDTPTQSYYYLRDKKDDGVLYIVSMTGGYGFTTGVSTLSEVKSAFEDYEYLEITPDSDEPYAYNLKSNADVISYTFDNKTVVFAFSDNVLASVSIYDNEKWTLN